MLNTSNNRYAMIDRRQITQDPTFRHRSGDDSPTHLAALRKTLRNTGRLDPVSVWQEVDKDGNETRRLVLLDGHYRVAAYWAEQSAGKIDGHGIPSVLIKGNRIDAELVALAGNVKDNQPLTPHERLNAAWLLVQRYRNAIPKSRLSKASGVAVRTIANMRSQLRKFQEAKELPSGNWLADRKFPLENEWTPPTDEAREAMINSISEGVRKALNEVRTQEIEIIGEGLMRAIGARQFAYVADYLLCNDDDEDRETGWMAPDEFEEAPDKPRPDNAPEDDLTLH